MSEEPRIIKKYSNRRLYDTTQSRYITLDELKKMVVAQIGFRVREAKTNEDITRATLMQALLSEESLGEPVFSEQGLRHLVAFVNGPMRGPVSIYFEQCLPMFVEAQKNLEQKFGASLGTAEMENIASLQAQMTRQVIDQYMFRGIENFLSAQEQVRQNMQKMMGGQMLGVPPFFPPPDKK